MEASRMSKPDRTGGALQCRLCERTDLDTAFASLFHRVCIECERTIKRVCACCQKPKQLTEFAICHTSGGHRERKCKPCKGQRLKPLKLCRGCEEDITGQPGNTQYCEECKTVPKVPTPPAPKETSNSVMAAFLMSPVRK